MAEKNRLYFGDNLQILREEIKSDTIDLVYLDPPFNSDATYNVLFHSPTGAQSKAQIEAFEDTWHWSEEAERAFDEVLHGKNSDAAEMLRAMRSFLHENDMMAYLAMMAVRLNELHRVLRPTGSLYLHCDPTASHYLKVLLDAIFGPTRFLNEVIWKRTGAHGSSKRWAPVHDVLLFYARDDEHRWNRVMQAYEPGYIEEKYSKSDDRGPFQDVSLTGAGTRAGESGRPWKGFNPTTLGRHWAVPESAAEGIKDYDRLSVQEKLDQLDSLGRIYWPKAQDEGSGFPRIKQRPGDGQPIQDTIVDIAALNSQAKERLGYPTQKPLALMERIIEASSNPGDLVLDPFCGCGTTIHAAQKLERSWIGIDITHLAISLIEKRLRDAFPGITFEVHGTPKDLDGARALATADKYQFQWWAVSLVNAVPFGGKKKGADTGIDGVIYFKADPKTTEKAIVSVKGGENINVAMIRDLAGVLPREKAQVGLFITLYPATKPMIVEAVKAGFFEIEMYHGTVKVPRIQILTIEELLAGKKPEIPNIDSTAFKKAEQEEVGKQGDLLQSLGDVVTTTPKKRRGKKR